MVKYSVDLFSALVLRVRILSSIRANAVQVVSVSTNANCMHWLIGARATLDVTNSCVVLLYLQNSVTCREPSTITVNKWR